MSFDLEQCMEKDGGKCEFLDHGTYRKARILATDMIFQGHSYAWAVAVTNDSGDEEVKTLCSSHELINIEKTYDVHVYILQGSPDVYVYSVAADNGYPNPVGKVLASTRLTLTEGKFIEESNES